MDKPIKVTFHAHERMVARGATAEEVLRTVREADKKPAKRGKWHSVMRFEFGRPSPVSGSVYAYKTVDAVFAEEPDGIVVLTVKVYYHDD